MTHSSQRAGGIGSMRQGTRYLKS